MPWPSTNAFFAAFPEMEFDSFLTIGADNSSYPSSMHPISVWGAIDAGLEFDQDGPGTNVLVNDEVGGSWFQTPPLTLDDSLTHPAFGGPEQRVLIAQITTPGRIYGQVQIQIFGEGQNSNEFRSVLQIPFAGCNDPAACTFDPNATLNDGSCLYPSNGFDCFGNCVGTVDACGVCEGDGTSCLGCTDAAACNYDPGATTTTALARTPKRASTATARASTPTWMACAIPTKSWDAPAPTRSTTTLPPPKTTTAACFSHVDLAPPTTPAPTCANSMPGSGKPAT